MQIPPLCKDDLETGPSQDSASGAQEVSSDPVPEVPSAKQKGPFTEDRTRSQSWTNLPQNLRGISLRELLEFYEERRDWIEELRWRCHRCKRCNDSQQGPCIQEGCGSSEGKLEGRNLYEVNEEMIMPACAPKRVSYVEHLAFMREHSQGGLEVNTFVSHWWGEEFSRTVQALRRYAEVQCTRKNGVRGRLHALTYILFAVLCPYFTAVCVWDLKIGRLRHDERQCSTGTWGLDVSPILESGTLAAASFLNVAVMLACVFSISLLPRGPGCRDPLDWTFWICAFCNNQYAVGHALGKDGDVCQSSFATALQSPSCSGVAAVFDKQGIIYSRIWCAFELFYVNVILPKRHNKCLLISLVNSDGIISDGDAPKRTLDEIKEVLDQISIAEASSSVESDKRMILEAIHATGTETAELDEVLKSLGKESLQNYNFRRLMPAVSAVQVACVSALISLIFLWFLKLVDRTSTEESVLLICGIVFFLLMVPLLTLGLSRWISKTAVDEELAGSMRARLVVFTLAGCVTNIINRLIHFMMKLTAEDSHRDCIHEIVFTVQALVLYFLVTATALAWPFLRPRVPNKLRQVFEDLVVTTPQSGTGL
eukprot:TRINITY_DN32991_c0_g1_i1.p1 TRINITY_DN32991_c0_g1~~TRINITY_DN32991_c0_g1_i1.p1  ORF type:complete len:596 (+),score=81.06 TRINITY_DN32991_c0_g1_i1:28-1815(+)